MKKKGHTPITRVKNPEPNNESPDWVIWAAWADRITFEEIEKKTGYSESEVIKIMRRSLKLSSFKLWRKRVITLFLHNLNEDSLSDRLIILITSDSEYPVFFSISSKVIRSAQAAQMTQSGLSLLGSGFLTRVIGV